MKKCVSCKSELPLQARFCNLCGVPQPLEQNIDEIDNVPTVRDPMPATDNALLPTPLIPLPPQREDENKIQGLPLPELSEKMLGDAASTGQFDSPLHNYYLQSQQLYGDHLQPQQPHGNHLQSRQLHRDHLQPQQSYGSHQQPQHFHGDHLQPQQSYGSHQQPQQFYQAHQQPYHNYQQPPNSMTHPTATITKAGTAVTKTGSAIAAKWVIVTVIAATVLGVSGVSAAMAFHPFHLFLPQPAINVISAYNAQGLPVGTDGTTLHVNGQKFAANSPITFLLDNTPLNETQRTQSDANGNVTADLAVTSAWNVGQHTLTAYDASNTITTGGIQIDVVQPGQSHTPGPNGAPPDDANFTIPLNIQAATTNGTSSSYTYTLIITGHPDPEGGTVCASRDDGTSISDQGVAVNNASLTYNETSTYSCSGTYKGGKVSYSETLQTRTINFSSSTTGWSCTLNSPVQSYQQITGSYTDQHNFSGNFTINSIDTSMYTCNPAGSTAWSTGGQGTWTGTVSQS